MSGSPSLFQQLNAVLAGHPEDEVLPTVLQVLLTVIGVGAPDLARAEALIDGLPATLKPLLRKEWENYRAHRARVGPSEEIH
jgi:hypothetical protein